VTATRARPSAPPSPTFTDAGGPEAPGNYAASIDWGDGTVTAGTVSLAGALFSVNGDHVYGAEGTFTISVTVSDDGGSTSGAATTALVAPAAINGAG